MKADLLQLTSLVIWYWLPSLGSQMLLNLVYSLHVVAPATDARTRTTHVQLSRTAVVLGTLLYQLYCAWSESVLNYYTLLSLPLDVDSEGVKRSFRALARRYHPDKVGSSGQEMFILLRTAHDALSDATKRFAYDRFGPAVVEWKDCDSMRDHVGKGLWTLVAFYTINPALYAVVGYVSGSRSGVSFWRLGCLFTLLAFELQLLVSPEYPTWMTLLLPNTTIFQVRQMAHSLFVNVFFASLQLGAALDVLEYGAASPRKSQRSAEKQLEVVREKARMVDQLAEVVKEREIQVLARQVRPLRRQEGKEGGGRGMSEQEQELFDKIDVILLSRSLVQQFPQLAVRKTDDGGQVIKAEEEQEVKVKEQRLGGSAEQETMIKAEEKEQWTTEQSPTVKLAESGAVEEPRLTANITEEALDPVGCDPTIETKNNAVVSAHATSDDAWSKVEDNGSWANVDVSLPEAIVAPSSHVGSEEQDEAATVPQAGETAVAVAAADDAPPPEPSASSTRG